MNDNTILVLAVAGLGLLMALFAFSTARRRDANRAVSHEPEGEGDRLPVLAGTASRTGKELERAVALERAGRDGTPALDGPPPAPLVAPDEEALGVTRRQVLNRG